MNSTLIGDSENIIANESKDEALEKENEIEQPSNESTEVASHDHKDNKDEKNSDYTEV
jgi:hypothetical protein